jgi:hypothetical protein
MSRIGFNAVFRYRKNSIMSPAVISPRATGLPPKKRTRAMPTAQHQAAVEVLGHEPRLAVVAGEADRRLG